MVHCLYYSIVDTKLLAVFLCVSVINTVIFRYACNVLMTNIYPGPIFNQCIKLLPKKERKNAAKKRRRRRDKTYRDIGKREEGDTKDKGKYYRQWVTGDISLALDYQLTAALL